MRTPLTYYGGKQRLADEIASRMPAHRVYLEPFAGGLAVLFRKPRAERETINDLDGAVVSFWRAVRDEPERLAAAVAATPYARSEWEQCKAGLDADGLDDVERARRLVVSIDQSYARSGDTWSTPSLFADRRGRWQAGTWENLPAKILVAADRLTGVALENYDALGIVARWDIPEAVIYCDPPYTGEHRINTERTRGYRHDNHPELWPTLVDRLLEVEHAAILLSGYPCDDSARLEEAGWTTVRLRARRSSQTRLGKAGSMAPETVWLNPVCAGQQQRLALEVGAA